MMNTDQLEAMRTELATAKREIITRCDYADSLIVMVIDEARRMETEARQLVTFTEAQAAAQLQISESTLARLRKDRRLPHFRPGDSVRYTQQHVIEIVRIFGEGLAGLRAA
jgi:excisionase family DNA binding protein